MTNPPKARYKALTGERVRVLLKANPDGMTLKDMLEHFEIPPRNWGNIYSILRRMPDAYIDHWVQVRFNWAAIWALADIPPDCPRPRGKRRLK